MFIGRVFAVANAEFLLAFQKHGWWKSMNAKDNYIEDSLDSKLSVSRQISSDTVVSCSVVCACLVRMLLFPICTVELWHMSIGSVGTIFVTLYVSKRCIQ